MNTRRRFLRTIIAAPPLACASVSLQGQEASTVIEKPEHRLAWVKMLVQVVQPVLSSLASNLLKSRMPIECPRGRLAERSAVTHLEALGRTVCGVAPWLGVSGLAGTEEAERLRLAEFCRRGITNALDPASPDHLNFTAGGQNLVDAAFLALGLARGRAELWEKLDPQVRDGLIAALGSTRKFQPGRNNWLLFSAMIEAFLASVGAEWKPEPIDVALRAHEEWYKGDGTYGDGPEFHWDYYNSYVIQPFLLELLELLEPVTRQWSHLREPILRRARRYAAVQARLIAPDGSYPPLGRSITYRCGAFHHLATVAWKGALPDELAPAQVRGALSAVIARTLGAQGTFDEAGWLRVGLAGHQPMLAEGYISTGSLYLCTLAFLPLGLKTSNPFWSAAPELWGASNIWSGADMKADHAI